MARNGTEAARRRLREAATAALMANGPSKLRLKDIASAAEMTSAGILYHYPNIDDLVREIYEEAVERWSEERRSRIEAIDDPLEKLDAMITSGMPTSPGDSSVRLLCELEGVSVRNPDYAALMRDLFDRQVALYAETISAAFEDGVARSALDPQEIARVMVLLEDSLSYYILNEHPSLDAESSRTLVRNTLAALIQRRE